MSHEIFHDMVYSYKQPMWHAITEPSDVPMTATEILNGRMRGGFPIHMRPVTVTLNGKAVETGDFAIVRGTSNYDKEEVVFGYCSERYLPLQPVDVCNSFDVNVDKPAETMAFLREGREMFISWVMPKCDIVTTAGTDEVQLYGIIRTGFDTLKGANLFTAGVRPVCWNTITLAQNWAKSHSDGNGTGNIWKGKAVNHNLLRDLGYWMAHVQGEAEKNAELMTSFFGQLAKTPIQSDVEAHEILFEAFPPVQDTSGLFPKELRSAKEEKIAEENASTEEIRDGIYALFAGAGTAITPDYWGMLNSTTEYFCHVQPSKRPIAESVMFGPRQKNTMRMVKTLSERVA